MFRLITLYLVIPVLLSVALWSVKFYFHSQYIFTFVAVQIIIIVLAAYLSAQEAARVSFNKKLDNVLNS